MTNDSCIFCRIAAGDTPARILYEDDAIVAFEDADPQAPVHLLLIPRTHVSSIDEVGDEDRDWVARLLLAVPGVAREAGIAAGHRLVINTGGEGGQTVDHVHAHLLGGRQMRWPPG